MRKHTNFSQTEQQGFTIAELLIATAVFTVMLLLVTFSVLQISRTYYKGVTATKTQQTARTIMDQISQAVQFSGGSIYASPAVVDILNPTDQAFCVNLQRYSYHLGQKLVEGANHALVADTYLACGQSPTAQNLSSASVSGTELLSPNMRLAKLMVEDKGNGLFKVTLKVIYGDDDLLIDNTGKKGGKSGFDVTTAKCVGTAGSQFCAFSELTSTVQKRISVTLLISPSSIPAAPVVTATAGNASVQLSWSAPSNGGSAITGYNVYRGTSPGGESSTAIASPSSTSYNDTGLTNGTTYYYKVSAVNGVGEGSQSNEASATPVAPCVPTTTACAPVLTATGGSNVVHLSWTVPAAPPSYPISYYYILRSTTSGNEAITSLSYSNTYDDFGVTNGTTYYYKVQPYNAYGAGALSNEVSKQPPNL